MNEAEALRMVQAGTQGVIRKTAPLGPCWIASGMVAAGNTWMDELMFQSADKTNGSGRSSLTSREQQVAEVGGAGAEE